MALTQISTEGIKNGTITGSDLATNIDLVDNQKLRLGTGNDLEIFHDGSNSYIEEVGTGSLITRTGTFLLRRIDNNNDMFVANGGGSVELYFDGSRKLRTKTAGVEIEGELGMADNYKIKLGTGEDLQIYHDGSNSLIVDNGTGGLILGVAGTGTSGFYKGTGQEPLATFEPDGPVSLYHNNVKKFETTSTGVTVTGALATTSLSATGGITGTGGNFILGDSSGTSDDRIKLGAGGDLHVYHDGTDTYVSNATGDLRLFSVGGSADDVMIRAQDDIQLQPDNGDNGVNIIGNGAVELYYDNSKKFETTSTGVTVTGKIATTGGSSGSTVFNEDGADVDFRVEGDTQASLFKVDAGNDRVGIGESDPSTVFHVTQFNHAFADSTSSLATVPTKSVARFRGSNNASGSLFIGNESNAAKCYLQGCNDTGNGSIDILLNPFGANVGIGTTSPATKLHINGGTYAAPTGGNDGFTQLVISNQSAGQGAGIGLLGAGNMVTFIHFGDSDDANVGAIVYNNVVDSMQFYVNASERMNIDSSGNLNINNDSGRLRIGTHADLQIYHNGNTIMTHDGTGHFFVETTGSGEDLYLQANDDVRIRTAANKNAIICNKDDNVQLFHNNVQMVSTASDGIQLQGDTKLSRHPNSNSPILAVTNAQYAKSLFIGGWDGGTNSSGISRVRNSNDNLHIDSGSAGAIYLNAYSSGEIRARHIRPMSDNTFDLGQSNIRWDDVFATNGTIQTSDKTKKNTIVDSDLGLSFINKLKPVSYKFNDGTRTHYGLIAQDIETLLSEINKTTTDFAGFIKTDIPDEYYEEAEPNIPDGKKEGDLKSAAHTEYGLRYTEFISPLIKAMQELADKVEVLETEVAALKTA